MVIQYLLTSLNDIFKDPFDPEEFVERLAWRTSSISSKPGSKSGDSTFDPVRLHDSFVHAIRDLRILQDDTHRKCERLEMICGEEEKCYWQKIENLQDSNEVIFHNLFYILSTFSGA